MKKRYKVLWVLMIGLLTACSSPVGIKELYFTGTIEKIYENSGYVSIEDGAILTSGDEVVVNLSVAEDIDFQIGDRIEVGYDGLIRESYPLGINTLSIKKIEEANER